MLAYSRVAEEIQGVNVFPTQITSLTPSHGVCLTTKYLFSEVIFHTVDTSYSFKNTPNDLRAYVCKDIMLIHVSFGYIVMVLEL